MYRYVDPNVAGAQYEIYKNGQLNNGGWADKQNNVFTADAVDRLALGRDYIAENSPPFANVILDEILLIDGPVSADLAQKLYTHPM